MYDICLYLDNIYLPKFNSSIGINICKQIVHFHTETNKKVKNKKSHDETESENGFHRKRLSKEINIQEKKKGNIEESPRVSNSL